MSPASKPEPLPAKLRSFLQVAYERPCFACGKQGECPHREPAVELAILTAVRRANA